MARAEEDGRADGIFSRTHVESASVEAPPDGSISPWTHGAAFSRYEIDSRLAAGGMAEVWRARIRGPAGFEKRIVIKTMLTHLQQRPDLVQMFVVEAAIAAQLSHPNIVHVFDFGQLEGRYFIAMEYVPGVTLRFVHKRALLRAERLPLATTLHVMIDVCEALHHLHELADERGALGLVHRDLSPDNIILSTSGAAKLIDFGAARATSRTPPTPMFVGKYRYAAPERIRNEAEDRRADVYSAGVILYECLVGARPFDGTDADVIKAATASRACDPRTKVDDLPAAVAEVIVRATAQNPADRFGSARELAVALHACLAPLGAFSKEREVTEALAALLEEAPPGWSSPSPSQPPSRAAELQAIPVAIEVAATESQSDIEIALCEGEILEASGPIRMNRESPTPSRPSRSSLRSSVEIAPAPPPLPVGVFGRGMEASGQAVLGWRTVPSQPPPEAQRSPEQRAVELFDRGLELRAQGHYGAALDAWEKTLRLAPLNRVYETNVSRLRGQLQALRADEFDRSGADARA